MAIISDQLRASLPPLFAQEADDDPVVYARLFLPGTSLNWYVLEGGVTKEHGFVLSCLFVGREEWSFGHFPESFLEQFRGPNGEVIEIDTAFPTGRLHDVVPAPDS